jgi:hypothetical protein
VTAPAWRVWIAEGAAAAITQTGMAAHPRETGGVLVGVHTHGSRPWITHAVELPSKKATGSFYEVPAGARRKAIARLRRQDRRLGYLGEWHVHPADVEPSSTDTDTMSRLAADPEAGCKRPVLLVARLTSAGYRLNARQLSYGKLRELQVIATGPLAMPESARVDDPKRRRGGISRHVGCRGPRLKVQ